MVLQRSAEAAVVAPSMGPVQALTEEQEEQGFAAEMRAKAQAKRKAMAPEPAPVGFLSVSSLSVAFLPLNTHS